MSEKINNKLKKSVKEVKFREKILKILDNWKEETKEINELVPKRFMIKTNGSTGEELVSLEYHELMEKLYVKRIKSGKNTIYKLFKEIAKLK